MTTYNFFKNVFLKVLNEHAPYKKKILRANHAPYMTKALRKVIMKRSQLQTKYFKERTAENELVNKKQRNFSQQTLSKRKEEMLQQFRFEENNR